MIFAWYRLRKYNQSPLLINTYEGSNSPCHPSVLFDEHGIWGGYRYIMSETPFYLTLPTDGDQYRDQFENPSIHFSNDGIHWIEKFKNPISILDSQQLLDKDYYSDPDLVRTPWGVELWYRINRRYGDVHKQENISILRKKSTDGIEWSEEEEIINLEEGGGDSPLGKIVISPAVVFFNGVYQLWYVDNIHTGKGRIRYAENDSNLKNWKGGKLITMNGPQIFPWHIHVLKDGDIYWMTIYDRKNISLWKGNQPCEFTYQGLLLKPCNVIGSFYSHRLYRACLVKAENKYRLYFSGWDLFRSYIGMMEGDVPNEMSLLSINDKKFRTLKSFCGIWVHSQRIIMWQYIKRIINAIKRKGKIIA